MTDRLSAFVSGTRFGKFASVGAVGAAFDLSLSSLLVVFFDVANELAKLAGVELAIIVMFVTNDRWTFVDAGSDPLTAEIRHSAKSNPVRSGGLLAQVLIVQAPGEVSLPIPVAGINLWELIPLPLAIGVSILLNYVTGSLFTWHIATHSSQRNLR